jgi:hypothetical protein
MAADRPAVRPPDTLKVRGRLRPAWLALWLAGAAGCVAVGLYGDTPEDTLGSHQIFLSLFLFLAAVSVVVAVRGFGRGLDADGNGVVVRNMLRAISIPWRELAAIEFKGVDSVAISDMYYQLVFQRHDGSRVTPRHPAVEQDPASTSLNYPAVEQDPASTSLNSGNVCSPCDNAATWPLLDASNPTTWYRRPAVHRRTSPPGRRRGAGATPDQPVWALGSGCRFRQLLLQPQALPARCTPPSGSRTGLRSWCSSRGVLDSRT